jgi:chemotaxis signal transduction protein
MFTTADRRAEYVVGYVDYPQEMMQYTDTEKMLEGSRDGAVANVNGELTPIRFS